MYVRVPYNTSLQIELNVYIGGSGSKRGGKNPA